MNIGDLRKDYRAGALRRSDLDPDPMRQFEKWFSEAQSTGGVIEPNAMTLATSGPDGGVSARIVLLKAWDADGFKFFTNYGSDKANDIAANPRIALLFFWAPLERQVQIRGVAAKTSREESESYFRSRPFASRIGALASDQSRPVASREMLEQRFAELEVQCTDGEVPFPENWGGYVVKPESIEFWQGRRSRLHDRFVYTRDGGAWTINRLSP